MKEGNINELKFDKKNFNKHTARGMALLGKSLKEHGAGRSVLVDKDNNLIGGNGVVESARKAGIKKTIVVETTGEELVVVKRTDVSLDSKQGREMALADNSTAAADLNWDFENLKELDKWDIKADDWGAEIISPDQFGNEPSPKEAKDMSDSITQVYKIEIDCADESEQERLFNELTEKGLSCRILTF